MRKAPHHPGFKSPNKPQSEMTAYPTKYPQGYFKEKECKQCKTAFKPKAPSHLYCSQSCADLSYTNRILKNAYGIEHDSVKEMFKQQDGKCAICGSEGFILNPKQELKLVVDHCHKSGKVRGMLCHNCNRALGLFKDSVESLNKAIDYLNKV